MIATTFDLQGHRGARGLAPENTLPAFSRALDIGVSTLELDTAISRDGVVVVAHDRRLNPEITRDCNGHWITRPTPTVHQLSYSQLREYDVGRINPGTSYAKRFPDQTAEDGVRMPRLEEVFAMVRARGDRAVRFNIETKISPLYPDETPSPDEFVRTLIHIIVEAKLEQRVMIQSFDWRTLRTVAELRDDIALSFLSTQRPSENTIETTPNGLWTDGTCWANHRSLPRMIASRARPNDRRVVWSPNYLDLTADHMQEAHDLGIEVIPWTINEVNDMRALIGNGADGLITDYPDRAKAILNELAMRSP